MAMVGESGSENSGSEERETYEGDSGAEDDEDEYVNPFSSTSLHVQQGGNRPFSNNNLHPQNV